MNFFAEVGDAEVVSSGTVFAKQDDDINLHPFGSDAGYKIAIKLKIVDDENVQPEITLETGEFITLHLTRPWLDGRPNINLDIIMAQTEDHTYSMSFSLNVTGVRERFAIHLSYSLQRRRK